MIRDLRLLMVAAVRILNKQVIQERNKRTARVTIAEVAVDDRSRVDLSHVVEDGMTTYPGLPGPVICDYLSREESRARYESGTEFQIGRGDPFTPSRHHDFVFRSIGFLYRRAPEPWMSAGG